MNDRSEQPTVPIPSAPANPFPHADEPAADRQMDVEIVEQLASSSDPRSTDELAAILHAHGRFLDSGGRGGFWQLLSVSGMPLCIYQGASGSDGEQAVFRLANIAGAELRSASLEHADLSGAFAESTDFTDAKLTGSVAIDSIMRGAVFDGADLRQVDFSGAQLQGASFRGADLRSADFECADVTGADFTGANLDGSRFPGAVLDNVVR